MEFSRASRSPMKGAAPEARTRITVVAWLAPCFGNVNTRGPDARRDARGAISGITESLRVGDRGSAARHVPRHGMGDARTRRPQAVRIPRARGSPSGIVLADCAEETRCLSPRIRLVRSGARRTL